MKIIENRSIGLSAVPNQGSYAPPASAEARSSRASKTSSVEKPLSPASISPEALSVRANQTALADTERAIGTISRLAETIKQYPPSRVLTPLQNSVVQSAASLQRAYPRYAQRLRNLGSNIDLLTSEIAVIKRELNDGLKGLRQNIAKTLIAEQNKNASAKQSYSPAQVAAFTQTLDPQKAKALFTRRPNAAELLQG